MWDSYHFKSLIDSYKLYFVEYDKEAESWSEVKELNIAKTYKKYYIGEGWCNRGFSGTGKCTPPKVQVLQLGLGDEIECLKSEGVGAICFSIELEINRKIEYGEVSGTILINLKSKKTIFSVINSSLFIVNY